MTGKRYVLSYIFGDFLSIVQACSDNNSNVEDDDDDDNDYNDKDPKVEDLFDCRPAINRAFHHCKNVAKGKNKVMYLCILDISILNKSFYICSTINLTGGRRTSWLSWVPSHSPISEICWISLWIYWFLGECFWISSVTRQNIVILFW